ncbi:MAG: endonuclease domain-containing protein, partial [bacterium]|nr:endonuclease domain-containing protein [bacterium]
GAKFRRQHPLKGYILDFYCPEAGLVVELDGGGHAEESKIIRDKSRTEQLEEMGMSVIRFWNTDVYNNLEGVLLKIAEHIPGSPSP